VQDLSGTGSACSGWQPHLLVRTQANPSTMKFWHGSGAEAQRVAVLYLALMQQVSIHEQALASTYFPRARYVGSTTMSGLTMSVWECQVLASLPDAKALRQFCQLRMRVDCLRCNRAGCDCHDWGRPIKLNPDGTFRFRCPSKMV